MREKYSEKTFKKVPISEEMQRANEIKHILPHMRSKTPPPGKDI